MSRDETFLGRWSRRKQEKPEAVIAEDHALAQARTSGESIAPSPPGGDEAMPASAATIPAPADLPAVDSLKAGALPIGLAHKVKLLRDVPMGRTVAWSDVALDADNAAVKFRRKMEKTFASPF